MIVKTGANYQSEGGYIEASISNDIITFKTGSIDMRAPVSASNVYGSIVNGNIKLNGASEQAIIPNIISFSGGHRYSGSQYVQPDTETEMQWTTVLDMLVTSFISAAGYTDPVLSSNSKNCSMLKSGGNNYLITVTGDDFLIDIVEGA